MTSRSSARPVPVLRDAWETIAKPHYEVHDLLLPGDAEHYPWFVKAPNGQTHRLIGPNADALARRILALQPLRIEYGTRDRRRPTVYRVTPFHVPSRTRLDLLARILADEFGLEPRQIAAHEARPDQFQLVASGGIFRDVHTTDLRRLLTYFDPTGFQATNRHAGPQQRYDASLTATIEAWRAMNPAQLADHLRAKTPLGNEAARVRAFLDAPGPIRNRLPTFGRLADHLHAVALTAAFPTPQIQRTLQGARIALPGSIDALHSHVVTPIPLPFTNQGDNP